MRNTLQEQYNLIKEGKGNKQQFFKSARHLFPNLITPVNTLNDAVTILKNKGIISEMFVGGGVVIRGGDGEGEVGVGVVVVGGSVFSVCDSVI